MDTKLPLKKTQMFILLYLFIELEIKKLEESQVDLYKLVEDYNSNYVPEKQEVLKLMVKITRCKLAGGIGLDNPFKSRNEENWVGVIQKNKREPETPSVDLGH